jgi:glycosyltransferase involved in cell wall biosynthesis
MSMDMEASIHPGALPAETRPADFSLSVVVPVYNEASNVEPFGAEIRSILDGMTQRWEIIFVNDGSADQTLALLSMLRATDPRFKIIDLSRNFGKEVALSAGIDYASGDAIISMDGDLQHPPELVTALVQQWQTGADVVFAVRRNRKTEGPLRQLTSRMFYSVMEGITEIPMPQHIGDFCLLDKKVAKVLKSLPEQNRFMKGLFAWGGFNQQYIFYEPKARSRGETKWGYWRLWNLAIEGITSFSTIPLRIWTYVGATLAAICFSYAMYIVAQTLIYGVSVPGYASLMVAILFMGSIQLISFGALGEYIGRIYTEVKGRPLYLVNKLYGLDPKD